ncbi:DUF5082 family protein [Metabacillus sp. FJAT-52054]|uniref:DUF5082 family protein n=1 Tax=Metabacillus sediminis TaxID=3117746 RepID=A0ABZ2NHH2_9BACI
MNASALHLQLTGQVEQLYEQIRDYGDKVKRLQSASNNISEDQRDFIQNKKQLNQPELSTQIWNGKRADQFQEFREKMAGEYNELSSTDTNEILNEIESKIDYYQDQMNALQHSISILNVQISNIKEES